MRFVDEVQFVVASGTGGDGCVSFRREKFVPRGGPNGGDGGRGGDLVLEATTRRNTLVDFRRNKLYKAPDGRPGQGRNKTGASGKPLILMVPVGTVVYDAETGEQLADLDAPEARWALRGGKGGLGNTHFKSSRRRTPLVATQGKPGITLRVRAELKLIADVGLLGFPNAGKSTLISRISAARPKVADYPFTTLTPNLGVVQLDHGSSFVVADIPGLIEGAAEGAGLGHQFLRHVERCALYAHLVPLDGLAPPEELFEKLNSELRAYDPALADRPQLVLLTKADLLPEDQLQDAVDALGAACGQTVLPMSSITGAGLQSVTGAMWRMLQDHRKDEEQH